MGFWKSNNHAALVLLVWQSTCMLFASTLSSEVTNAMPAHERAELKEEARDMFYHAYNAYMDNAYPADELMPLSCSGRWRGTEASRGDIDDTLGNFSLTLIDTLDTLVVLGDVEEFERAVKLIIKDVTFDSDIIVSVFETNIRVLGGLLSGHTLAEYLQHKKNLMLWYRGELLSMAKDVGFRLLPAFNTSTGIPHARVNLRYGLKVRGLESSRETCTACAGTMILEMAALSRLSGEPIFEEKAHRAMDELWRLRHRSSDLMGTVLNVHSGDWVRRDSGVGAGIDSYYEYCLKAYILLGDDRYLGRFNKHYSAVMRYISQGPMLLDVHMHRPHTNSRNFMDALLAFWPGLQVLKGDIKPAVETHEMLYQVMQRHNFIPEAFTTDFQVHWGQHPLRPEFLESTYFLYRATGDPYYLEVGRNVLKSLQKFARVPCGYAAVKDVRTNIHEDRMDSFVLAETLKYLYLLFADPSDLLLDLDQFLFTTEAHLLPLTLARSANYSLLNLGDSLDYDGIDMVGEDILPDARTCPNTQHLFPEKVRRPLRNMVDGVCPRKQFRRKLRAIDFQMGNVDHLKLLKDMGINIMSMEDGRVQLVHAFGNAASSHDAEEGLLFMQEMVELSKTYAPHMESQQQAVSFIGSSGNRIVIQAGPAHFGRQLRFPADKVAARVHVAVPLRGCQDLVSAETLKGRIVILERGDCMFIEKARRIQKAGAVAGIVVDHTPGTSAATSPMFAMSGDGTDDITIPMAFLFYEDALKLLEAVQRDPLTQITLSSFAALEEEASKKLEEVGQTLSLDSSSKESTLEKLKDSIIQFLNSPNSNSPPENPPLQPPPSSSTTKRAITATPILHPPKYAPSEGAGTITPILSEPPGGSTNDFKVTRLHELLISTMLQRIRGEDGPLFHWARNSDSSSSIPSGKDRIPAPILQLYSLLLSQGRFALSEDAHLLTQMNAGMIQSDIRSEQAARLVSQIKAAMLQSDMMSERDSTPTQDKAGIVQSDTSEDEETTNNVPSDIDTRAINFRNKMSEKESFQPSSVDVVHVETCASSDSNSVKNYEVLNTEKVVLLEPPHIEEKSETVDENSERTSMKGQRKPDEL